MVCIGRDLKDNLIPTPLAIGRDIFQSVGKTGEQLLLLVFVAAFCAKGWEEFGVQGD